MFRIWMFMFLSTYYYVSTYYLYYNLIRFRYFIYIFTYWLFPYAISWTQIVKILYALYVCICVYIYLNKIKKITYETNQLFCDMIIKVSSNKTNWGINKWRFIINASNIHVHPQIALLLLNVVSFYNLCNNFCR